MNKFAKQLLPFCSLIFIISLWAALEPENFLSVQNFSNVLRRSSVNGIMAAGMTFIIITAGSTGADPAAKQSGDSPYRLQ